MAAQERARTAWEAARRAKPKDRTAAEIKAHRAEMAAAERESVMADRIALQEAARKMPAEPPPHGARRLDKPEIDAAVDRAMARQRGGAS
jgi:hypothetical protein